ncbi:MAG TPA: monovalent cation:proton antiporter-2 (CPA2) family protein [Longimicrobiaceae bacterium]|nr:monovalent cation:proton antiporter-2 (CPA2) family protein [Longimicrobiaceae bacterium]
MSSTHILRDILLILAAAVVVVPVFHRLGASSMVGYLVAGVLIGPSGLDLIGDVEQTEVLGHFGVVFLLFAIGLELSVGTLVALRRQVFGLGALQVVLTALGIWAALRAGGVGGAAALVLGGGLALSSTAVVLRMLVERGELSSQHGRVTFAVLLFQDLAVVPLLVLVPLLGAGEPDLLGALGLAVLRAVGVLVVIGAVGRLLMRPALRAVAAARSPELFTAVVLLLVLGVGLLTELAGLSMAMGAFLAGLLIAETEYRPQVEADIEPFRGVLLALFFMTVGMGIDLSLLVGRAPLVLGMVLVLVALKAVVAAGLCHAFGFGRGVSTQVGLTLAQGGEFGFVVFALAARTGTLRPEVEQLALLVVGLSMTTTPLLALAGRWAGRRLTPVPTTPRMVEEETEDLSGHVLIAGFGRVGRTLARILEAQRIPYVALDSDPDVVTGARARSLPVFFGDASRGEVLRTAGVQRARAAVVTLDQPDAALRAVGALRQHGPDLPVLVRARDVRHSRELRSTGASEVVPEVVEGSLQLGGALLRVLRHSPDEVEGVLESFRQESYARLEDLTPSPGDGGEQTLSSE